MFGQFLTTLLLRGSVQVGRRTISHRIEIYAGFCIESSRNFLTNIVPPTAEASPVFSESISIVSEPIKHSVVVAIFQQLALVVSQVVIAPRGVKAMDTFDNIALTGENDVGGNNGVISRERQIWRRSAIQDLYPSLRLGLENRALSSVDKGNSSATSKHFIWYPLLPSWIIAGELLSQWIAIEVGRDRYPCSLTDYKVVPKIPPLEKSDNGIGNSKWYCDQLQPSLPPLGGSIPWAQGLVGIFWGGLNLRDGRRLPFSGIAFAAGCSLWASSCLVLLPWLANLSF